MNRSARFQTVICTLAATAILLSPLQGLQAAAPTIADVQLTQGALKGQLVNGQGQAQANAVIQLHDSKGQVLEAKTDQNGNFNIALPRGGTYTAVVGQRVLTLRAWTEGTAPPSAAPAVLLVTDDTIVRGTIATNPMLTAFMAVAAGGAIAGGVAAADNDSAS